MSGYATINIRHNFPAIAAKLDRLADNVGNKAMVRALNTTVAQGKIQMARQISQEFRVTISQVKERLAVTRAYTKGGAYHFQASLQATRKGKGRSMNLIAFVKNKASGSKAQLRFQIKRGGGNKTIKGAFIGNKGRTVFIREGKGRIPIKAINTIDIPQMFNARRVNSVVRAVILQKFQANFQRELRAVLRGFAR